MNLKVTPLSVAIHDDHVNPVFGDETIHLSVADEGAGPFIRIKTDLTGDLRYEAGEIQIDLEELKFVTEQAEILLKNYEQNQKLAEEHEENLG